VGKSQWALTIDGHARGEGGLAAGHGVLHHRARRRRLTEGVGGGQEDVGRRLAPGHLLGGHDGVEGRVDPEPLEDRAEAAPVPAGRQRHPPPGGPRLPQQLVHPGQQGQLVQPGTDERVEAGVQLVHGDGGTAPLLDQRRPRLVDLGAAEQVAELGVARRDPHPGQDLEQDVGQAPLRVDHDAVEVEDQAGHRSTVRSLAWPR
jgi:hypothetical protein